MARPKHPRARIGPLVGCPGYVHDKDHKWLAEVAMGFLEAAICLLWPARPFIVITLEFFQGMLRASKVCSEDILEN